MGYVRGNGQNGGHYYSNITQPVKIDLSFVVDQTNSNGLGLRSLKSNGYVQNVFMDTSSPASGSPPLGTARNFAVLGASAVTNTGSSVLTGNLGIFPGLSVTGFPPGTFSGSLHAGDVAAQTAQASALASYNLLVAHSSTVIPSALDGQTLTAGYYSFASGAATLAAAGAGTLTLSGSATDIFVIKTATTLTTGAGGIPTITLSGGAVAANVYWVVGSSATINSGFSGTFKGNLIAFTSITDTLGGTVNGNLIALNGAVTLSAATNIVTQSAPSVPGSGSPDPAPGYALIHLTNNYNHFLGLSSSIQSPLSGSNVAINGSALVIGQPYVISVVGTSTLANWNSVGLPAGFTPAVGQSFVATATGSAGTGQVQLPVVSGVNSVEVVGSPDAEIANSNVAANGGAYVLVQFLANSVLQAPLDGSVVQMSLYFDASSVTIDGL